MNCVSCNTPVASSRLYCGDCQLDGELRRLREDYVHDLMTVAEFEGEVDYELHVAECTDPTCVRCYGR